MLELLPQKLLNFEFLVFHLGNRSNLRIVPVFHLPHSIIDNKDVVDYAALALDDNSAIAPAKYKNVRRVGICSSLAIEAVAMPGDSILILERFLDDIPYITLGPILWHRTFWVEPHFADSHSLLATDGASSTRIYSDTWATRIMFDCH